MPLLKEGQRGMKMAQYRAVYCKFWSDSKVLDKFTVEDKYFWLYLLTNERTSQIGVYKFIKKIVAVELGYSLDVVETLLKRFETYHKLIKYSSETQEICILNWGVYNLNKGGAPIISCIKADLLKVEDVGLIKYILDNPKNNINEKVLEEINNFISLHYIKNKDVYLNENENEKEARTTSPTTNRTTSRKETFLEIKELWNKICKSYPQVTRLSDTREKQIFLRLKEGNDLIVLEKVFYKLEESMFCRGINELKWKASFDWIFANDTNIIKVLEGKYDNSISKLSPKEEKINATGQAWLENQKKKEQLENAK